MIHRTLPAALLASLLCSAPVQLLAHGKLANSQPARGAALAAAPTQIVLGFNEKMKLTRVSIESMDGSSRDVTPLPGDAAREIKLPAPALAPGRHEIQWRGIGADGHIVNGRVTFSIKRP